MHVVAIIITGSRKKIDNFPQTVSFVVNVRSALWISQVCDQLYRKASTVCCVYMYKLLNELLSQFWQPAQLVYVLLRINEMLCEDL